MNLQAEENARLEKLESDLEELHDALFSLYSFVDDQVLFVDTEHPDSTEATNLLFSLPSLLDRTKP